MNYKIVSDASFVSILPRKVSGGGRCGYGEREEYRGDGRVRPPARIQQH